MSTAKVITTLVRVLGTLSLALLLLIPTITTATSPPNTPPPSQETAAGNDWLTPTATSPAPSPEQLALQADLAAFEAARQQGPEAVLALAETLRGPARDLLMAEIVAARSQLTPENQTDYQVPGDPVAEETAVLAQVAHDEASRAQAFAFVIDPREGGKHAGETPQSAPTPVNQPAADRTVGSGCTYATINAAITAANPGDRLLIEGGVTFVENVIVTKNLSLQGGYAGCASGSTNRTVINGSASGSTVIVNTGLTVTLENLEITNGFSGFEGGGIRFAWGSGTGTLTLQNVHIYDNTAVWGGGLWVGPSAQVQGTNVSIHNNTATTYGGGVRLFGAQAVFTTTNVYANTAPLGAGAYGSLETIASLLDLRSYADLYSNQALTGNGQGGGVYMRQGTVLLADCSDIYNNDAIQGGGAYLITTTLTMQGDCSEIEDNQATNHGGGIYAQSSTINLDNEAELYNNEAGTGGAGNGGAAYLDNSDLWGDKALIHYNKASEFGGGVYATNGSLLDMDLGGYPCSGPRCSQLSHNIATTLYGGGVYATLDSEVDLRQVFIENNLANLGGGLYAYQSPVYLYNSLVAKNNASSPTGDGIRLYTGATFVGGHNTLAHNDSGGTTTGNAIGLSGATLSLSNSIIWGHASSINDLAQTVTCSDVEGGYTGTGNMNVDPLFVDATTANFHLQSGSPVLDRCAAGQTVDFDNEPRPVVYVRPATPYDMGADEGSMRVGINGAGCAYGRIQDAIDAAPPNASIQAAADTYFESVDIVDKNLTIAGGFATDCVTDLGEVTTVNGGGAGSVFDINNSSVLLRGLHITGGNDFGAGLDILGVSQVVLEDTEVHHNNGSYGGGLYISTNAVVTLTNETTITYNTASIEGGGARVWGRLIGTSWDASITHNAAPNGGGVSLPGGTLELYGSHVSSNQATAPDGGGGGIYVSDNGVITATNSSNISNNSAYNGGGIYADGSTIHLSAVVHSNVATHNGGGVYLGNGSSLTAVYALIGYPASGWGGNQAVEGAGMYVDASTVDFNGSIFNNTASYMGGGVYARASTLHLIDALVGGPETNQPNHIGPAGLNGGGLYLTEGTHAILQNSTVSSNMLSNTTTGYGGGLYVAHSSMVTLTNSLVAQHFLPSSFDGRGAGIYVLASTVTLDNSDILSNTASSLGGGVRVFDSGTLHVRNGSALRNNHALNGPGGAIAVSSGAPVVTLQNTTLRDNSASTDGGAIYQDAGTLDFSGGWTLRSNEAGQHGGALAVVGTADIDFAAQSYSLIYNNQAQAGNGGALYLANNDTVQLHATSGAQLYIYANHAQGHGGALYADAGGLFDVYGQVDFDRNWALTGQGGAIYLSNGSRIWLDDYVNIRPALWDNRAYAGDGGAIYAIDSPRVELDGIVLGNAGEGNLALSGSGGAIYLSGSTFHAENCTFQDNQATFHGGAIAGSASTLTLVANFASPFAFMIPEEVRAPAAPQATPCDPTTHACSALLGNVADSDANSSGNGGAIYTLDSTLTVSHTYLHHNQANQGGAIYQSGAGAVAEVSDSLIHHNSVTTALGAGIRAAGGTFTLWHVTLADNSGGAAYSQIGTSSAVHNSIAWGNSLGFMPPFTAVSCNIDQEGNAGFALDPTFVTPGVNYHLGAASPAIDACATGLSPDLDNVPRPLEAGYDMGAYEGAAEFLGFLPVVTRN